MSTQGPAATGIGSMPGEDYAEAVRVVLGELAEFPAMPELPARGAIAGLTGRGLAIVSDLGFDLQPAGWRLTGSSGVDHRRARSLLAQDLDVLEELAGSHVGELKIQVAGPWTLAATVEKPRGDRLLSDRGARRDLAQALAEGVGVHVADVRRRIPGASIVVQVDEPALPAVLTGRVPTASGFHRHRSVDPASASAALAETVEAVKAAGAVPVAHCCAAEIPIGLLRESGFLGISLDLGLLPAEAYDDLGTVLDEGERAFLGVLGPTEVAGALPTEQALADRILRLLDMLGFDPDEVADQLVLTPSCGLAGAAPADAREALTRLRVSASRLRSG